MIPQRSLVLPPVLSPFLPPDNNSPAVTDLTDVQLGGVALNNGTQGLQVQNWAMEVQGSLLTTQVWISATTVASTFLFARPNITWARMAFDQNMHPFIAFIDQNGPAFWWYDPTLPGQTFTSLTSDVTNPCCTMDDKRPLETRLGTNDIILSYVRNGTLYYRQQRDRYGTEYVLYTNINVAISNPKLNKIGMGSQYRLMFEINGSLYT